MSTRKIIVPLIIIVIAAVFGFYLRKQGKMAAAPTAPKAPQPSTQSKPAEKPAPQGPAPVAVAVPSFVAGHNSDEGSEPREKAVVPQKVISVPLPRGAVATVNGVSISAKQLEEELNRLMISPSTHGSIKEKKKDELRKLALEELVIRELAYQQAKKVGLIVTKREVAVSFKRIKQRYKTSGDFDEALKAEKMTREDLRRRVERDLLLAKINKTAIEDRARVGEAEARQHYETNKAMFVTPVSVHLWNIVVKVKPGKEAKAKEKIDKAYALILAGKHFNQVAYKYSEDDYRILGGDYGWIHRGRLAPELERVVFNARANEATQPFRTSFGWHIIKVGAVRPEKQLKYSEVKEKIKKGLYKRHLREARIEFINRLRASAEIKYAAGG